MVYRQRPIVLIVALLLCLIGTAPAAEAAGGPAKVLTFTDDSGRAVRTKVLPDPHVVQLRSETVDLRGHATKSTEIGRTKIPLVVAFDGALSTDLARALAETGAQVVGTLPPAAFLVLADAGTAAAIGELDDYVGMARFQDRWKISDRVPTGGEMAEVDLVLFDGADHRRALKTAEASGEVLSVFRVLDRFVIRAVLPTDAVDDMAALADVEMIDSVGQPGLLNNQVRVVMQTERQHRTANQAFYNPIYNIGVWGAGETVTLADTGLQAHEVYASAGKIVSNLPAQNSCVTTLGDVGNHGTGVAATLLGDKIGGSGLFGTANDFDGLALRANVAMQDIEDQMGNFCPPTSFAADLFYPAWLSGSMVHNNSWGTNAGVNGPGGTYSWRSELIDDYMSIPAFREQVILFAAGNAGASFPGGTTYRPYTISDEGHAKNSITVGGSGNGNNRDSMYRFSSRGPTNDCSPSPCDTLQRVKPDVLAPGTFEVDTADTAGYAAYSPFSGTSIATPAVAGAAALIRDYFGQGIYPVDPQTDPPLGGPPSAALIKAMLVNSTVPIYDPSGYEGNPAQGLAAGAYPNYDQGYGRPALDNVLDPASYRKLKVYEDADTSVETGKLWERTVTFRETWVANCSLLRFTLAWTDPAATLGAGPKLVNDLDLEVSFGGRTYKGNHFLTNNLVFDTANNVEDVFIPMRPRTASSLLNPVVRVYGSSVPQGPQPFAVVATYGACADRLPCDPPQSPAGCYRGPGDTVPGTQWNPGPGCGDQDYSSTEYDGTGEPFPACAPVSIGCDPTKQAIQPCELSQTPFSTPW